MSCDACGSDRFTQDQTSSSPAMGFVNGPQRVCGRCFSFWVILAVAVIAFIVGRQRGDD